MSTTIKGFKQMEHTFHLRTFCPEKPDLTLSEVPENIVIKACFLLNFQGSNCVWGAGKDLTLGCYQRGQKLTTVHEDCSSPCLR